MTTDNASVEQHKAGLFDIRFIIGSLLGVYGLILIVTGLVATDSNVQHSKAINLWAGVALVVVALAFGAWARLRPIVVPAHVESPDDDRPTTH
jgi:drug/metabolite transporter (DMT)-like permease